MKNRIQSSAPYRLVGCAGWSIPPRERSYFPESGSHLERYAALFPAVEINSSFYRPHRVSTYARWADSVPDYFRFSVKVPKAITHVARLEDVGAVFSKFLSEVAGLGDKLGCLLVQLPPSLAFDARVFEDFLAIFRDKVDTPVALEPRHATWFDESVEVLLERFHVARVAADPALLPAAAVPGGWRGFSYHRLHGSPQTYYSSYPSSQIRALAGELVSESSEDNSTWCIFDNTARGAATANARLLLHELQSTPL